MLDVVLKFFSDELNAYLQARTGVIGDVVALSPVVDDDGKYAIDTNSVGVHLINIDEDATSKEQLPSATYQAGQHVVSEPRLNLNLYVMFTANYSLYDQALKYTSHILTYFQSHRLFTPEKYPSLDQKMKRLTVELQSLNYDQLNQIWAFIGAKQLPSIIYRVRVLGLQDEEQVDVRPPIISIDTRVGSV